MESTSEESVNQAAFRQLRENIRRDDPQGWFVGIAEGRIVADAGSFAELDVMLNRMGFTSPDVFVAEAGVDYPERATIFCAELGIIPNG